jgi:hypothetical protein
MTQVNKQCAIEEMDQLLDHISSFEQDLKKSNGLSNASIKQEYRLLREYLDYRIHDMQKMASTELHQLIHPNT